MDRTLSMTDKLRMWLQIFVLQIHPETRKNRSLRENEPADLALGCLLLMKQTTNRTARTAPDRT